MKKWMSIILVMVMAVMCSTALAIPTFAAETPGVSIPVTVSLSGTLPSKAEDFTIILKADDAACPMPSGTEDGVYTTTICGAGTENIKITYSRVGIYTYTIYQVAGSNKKCTYDDTVYSLTVYISNAEDGSGLEATAVLYPDSEGDKLPGAEFKNVYETETPSNPDTSKTGDESTPDTPKTGDESNPVLYVVLIAVSMTVIVTLILTRRNKKVEE